MILFLIIVLVLLFGGGTLAVRSGLNLIGTILVILLILMLFGYFGNGRIY